MTTSETTPNSKIKTKPTWQPPIIDSLEKTGLDAGFLQDLVLKVMYFRGQITGHEIADQLCLPFQAVLAPIMDFIKREQMCEVKGSGGLGTGSYQYLITAKGSARAREQLERTTYVGAAPVPWEDYVKAMKAQGRKKMKVTPRMMKKALADLVMEDEVFDKIGPAVNSGKSIFLYGPPGNGKTTIAECIGRMVLLGDMYIPYSVIIDGQIVKVYDEINHEAVPEEGNGSRALTTGTLSSRRDQRWIRIRRPVIMVGGELTLDGLELIYDRTNKFYEAPFQMKANGGLFLIDDFGRQQVRPRDLLNRWIVPMEKQIDFLAMHTGSKVEVPFEVLLVFSTNLPPRDLVDEAFLRRIRHKIHVTSPTYDGYREIFQRVARRRGVPYDEETIVYLLQEHYIKKNRKLRANHPRDLVDQIMDISAYLDVPPRLTVEMIDRAADAYFVEL
jgi:predicted ATPase with chaperone activity